MEGQNTAAARQHCGLKPNALVPVKNKRFGFKSQFGITLAGMRRRWRQTTGRSASEKPAETEKYLLQPLGSATSPDLRTHGRQRPQHRNSWTPRPFQGASQAVLQNLGREGSDSVPAPGSQPHFWYSASLSHSLRVQDGHPV